MRALAALLVLVLVLFAFAAVPVATVHASTPPITVTALCQPECKGVSMLTAGMIVPAGTVPATAESIIFDLTVASPAGIGLGVPNGWGTSSFANTTLYFGWTLLLGYPSELWSVTGNYTLTATLSFNTAGGSLVPLASASTTFYYIAGTNSTAIIEEQLTRIEQQNQALSEQLNQTDVQLSLIQQTQASQSNQLSSIQSSVTSGFTALSSTLSIYQSSLQNKLGNMSSTLASISALQSEILQAIHSINIPSAPSYSPYLLAILAVAAVIILLQVTTLWIARKGERK